MLSPWVEGERIAAVGLGTWLTFDLPIGDAEGLARITNDFADRLKKIPGVVDVEMRHQPDPRPARGAHHHAGRSHTRSNGTPRQNSHDAIPSASRNARRKVIRSSQAPRPRSCMCSIHPPDGWAFCSAVTPSLTLMPHRTLCPATCSLLSPACCC